MKTSLKKMLIISMIANPIPVIGFANTATLIVKNQSNTQTYEVRSPYINNKLSVAPKQSLSIRINSEEYKQSMHGQLTITPLSTMPNQNKSCLATFKLIYGHNCAGSAPAPALSECIQSSKNGSGAWTKYHFLNVKNSLSEPCKISSHKHERHKVYVG